MVVSAKLLEKRLQQCIHEVHEHAWQELFERGCVNFKAGHGAELQNAD